MRRQSEMQSNGGKIESVDTRSQNEYGGGSTRIHTSLIFECYFSFILTEFLCF